MKKSLLLTLIFSFLGAYMLFAQNSSLDESYARLTINGATKRHSLLLGSGTFATNFGPDGALPSSLGTFPVGSTNLILKGSTHFTTNGTTETVVDGKFYYRVFRQDFMPSAFTTLDLPTGGANVWDDRTQNINLVSGLSPGNYQLDLYNSSSYQTGAVTTSPGRLADDGGTFYNSSFVILGDLGVTAISTPNTACVLGGAEDVTITVQNFGAVAIPSGATIPVQYQINGGAAVIELITLSTALAATNGTVSYTFATKANLSTDGASYIIDAKTNIGSADTNTSNDAVAQKTVVNNADVNAIITKRRDTICINSTSFSIPFDNAVGTPNKAIVSLLSGTLSGFPKTIDITPNGSGVGSIGVSLPNDATAGTYAFSVIFQNSSTTCQSTGKPDTLIIAPLTTVTNPEANPIVCSGASKTLSVTATGTALTYQWYRGTTLLNNGSGYNGTKTANLVINPAASTHEGNYTVQVSGFCPTVTSGIATLTVHGPVTTNTITPSPPQACANTPITLNSAATNSGSGTNSVLTYQWQRSIATNGTYTNIAGATIRDFTFSPTAAATDSFYRVLVGTSVCTAVASTPVDMNVEGPVTITANPSNVTVCAGTNHTFSVTANANGSGTLAYQWQINEGSGFVDITDSTRRQLVVAATNAKNGYKYKVLVKTGNCANVPSNEATLTVQGVLDNTITPATTHTICSGTSVTFTSAARNNATGNTTGLTYQWQRTRGVAAPTNIAGATNATYTFTARNVANDSIYSVLVGTSTCPAVASAATTLKVDSIAITIQTKDSTVCDGANVEFLVNATSNNGTTLTYSWEEKAPTGSFATSSITPTTIVGGSKISFTATAAKSGYQYRVRISTLNCSQIISNVATLTVQGPIENNTISPVSPSFCAGATAVLTSDATSAVGALSYQWELKPAGGMTFNPISGATGKTFTINPVRAVQHNGNEYQVKVSTSKCPVLTAPKVTLNVDSLIFTATTATPATTICSPNPITFASTVTNSGNSSPITLQWKFSINGTAAFNDVTDGTGGTTNSYTTGSTLGKNGYRYALEAKAGTCTTMNTPTTITVKGPPSITAHPTDVTQCAGQPTSFRATAVNGGAGTLQYQWQESTDGGMNYTDLTNTTPYQNVTTATLGISNVIGLDANKYRVKVNVDATGAAPNCSQEVISNGATLTEALIFRNPFPAADTTVTSCTGNTANLVLKPLIFGDLLTFQWVSLSLTNVETNLVNGADYEGVDTRSLTIKGVALGDAGTRYRLVVTACGTPARTKIYTLGTTVSTLPTFTTQPSNPTAVCANAGVGSITNIPSTADATPATVSYRWFRVGSPDPMDLGGNIAPYSNATTSSLRITNAPTSANGMYYVEATANTCPSNPVKSNTVTFAVEGPITVTAPISTTECANNNHTFDVTGSNSSTAGTLSYVWKVSTDNGNTFPTTVATTEDLTLNSITPAMNGNKYQVTINTSKCSFTNPSVATLTVETITTADAGADQQMQNTPTFIVSGNTPAVGETGTWSFVSSSTMGSSSATVTAISGTNNALIENVAVGESVTARYTIVPVSGSSCSPYTNDVIVTNEAVLAVELKQFTATMMDSKVLLDWLVEKTDKDNAMYQVQRSANGTNFYNIGSVKGSKDLSYYFWDKTPLQGTNYYRLKIETADKKVQYSSIAAVRNGEQKINTFQLYPNPANDQITLRFESKQEQRMTLRIFNTLGAVVLQTQVNWQAGDNQLPISLQSLTQGTYYLQLINDNSETLQHIRFVKTN